jgi:hypothetical protein
MKKSILFCIAILVLTSSVTFAKDALVAPDLSSLPPEQAASEIIKLNDRDGNKVLSKDEVDLGFRLSRFKDVDKNSDGLLDQTELTNSYQQSAAVKKQQEASGDPTKQNSEGFFSKIKKQLSLK